MATKKATSVRKYTRKNGQKVTGHKRLFELPNEKLMLQKAEQLAAMPH